MTDDDSPWRNEETLRRLYYEEGLTQEEMAARLGCSQDSIYRQMCRHGLSPGEGRVSGAARQLLMADADDFGGDVDA